MHFKQCKFILGSVTIYLSLSLTLIVSLIIYTIESCHIDSLVAHSNGVTYLSLDSLFGQYCLPIFEKYGLFCLNEQGLNLEEEIKKYSKANSSTAKSLTNNYGSFLNMSVENIEIDNIKYLTDDDGEIFANQVCDYTKYLKLSDLANELIGHTQSKYPDMFEVVSRSVISDSLQSHGL